MIGAYRATDNFAYPGWRLTVPGGPAGGHYKGYTHNYSAGTAMAPQDDYEATRDEGMAAHDTVHVHPNAPRGVYRGPAEVPPRANASGQAFTYRGMQTARHAGTSVAPGSFPAEYFETGEDAFIHPDVPRLDGLDAIPAMIDRVDGGPTSYYHASPAMLTVPKYLGPPVHLPMPGPMPLPIIRGPIVAIPPAPPLHELPLCPENDPYGWDQGCTQALNSPCPPCRPRTGATNIVPQPPPQPPAPVLVVSGKGDLPVSPAPAPVVDTHQLVPIPDGSGNYFDSSDGTIVPASQVTVDASGKPTYKPGAQPAAGFSWSGITSWLGQNTIWNVLPNGVVLGGGVLLATMLFRGRGRR